MFISNVNAVLKPLHVHNHPLRLVPEIQLRQIQGVPVPELGGNGGLTRHRFAAFDFVFEPRFFEIFVLSNPGASTRPASEFDSFLDFDSRFDKQSP